MKVKSEQGAEKDMWGFKGRSDRRLGSLRVEI